VIERPRQRQLSAVAFERLQNSIFDKERTSQQPRRSSSVRPAPAQCKASVKAKGKAKAPKTGKKAKKKKAKSTSTR
jgi:hypothetical protein